MENIVVDRASSRGSPAPIDIIGCDPAHAHACELVAELSSTLAGISGDSGASSYCPDDFRSPRTLFVIARAADGALLGCGALRPIDQQVAELKRMYARPGTRGVGAALLTHLERAAAGFGYAAVWLETRRVNTRALDFYARHGYREIPNFGRYVGRLEAVCLGKTLPGHHASA